ncbi:unnamed protein product [Effrenium voratum]|nr:unnamed protein product [Effrenium voratum]
MAFVCSGAWAKALPTRSPLIRQLRCIGKVFGEDQVLRPLEVSWYLRERSARRKVRLQKELDTLLQSYGCASLASQRLDAVIEPVLAQAREEFRDRLSSQDDWAWRGFGCGWVFPRSAEMYSHPHYLAFIREDGSTDPHQLPFKLDELLEGIRRQLLPVLEDVLELGLGFEPGKLHQALQMTTAIVHYYPDTTKKETLLTPAAFHSDDSFMTLNFESTGGIHGLQAPMGAAPQIRRFRYEGEAEGRGRAAVNLFVGGYLQAMSQGRWRSLLHSGSNPSSEDRLSITIFLGLPPLHDAARQLHEHTRGQQEERVYEWLREAERLDEWTAAERFEEIQDMYSHGDGFEHAVRGMLRQPSPSTSKTRARHLRAVGNARQKAQREPDQSAPLAARAAALLALPVAYRRR